MRIFGKALWWSAGLVALLVALGLLGSGCWAPMIYVVGSIEEADCVRHLPRGTPDPSDGGYLYECTESHDGGPSAYRLLVFPVPGGQVEIPGEETIERASCTYNGHGAGYFGEDGHWAPACYYECKWPDGSWGAAQSAVECPPASSAPLNGPP